MSIVSGNLLASRIRISPIPSNLFFLIVSLSWNSIAVEKIQIIFHKKNKGKNFVSMIKEREPSYLHDGSILHVRLRENDICVVLLS